jgi:hypothetical protein
MIDRGLRAVAEDDREVLDLQQGLRLDRVAIAHVRLLRGSKASRTPSPMKTSRIKKPAQDDEARDAEPGGLEIGLALMQEIAQGGRAGRQAEAEEVQGAQQRDGAAHLEGQEGQGGDHRIGQ